MPKIFPRRFAETSFSTEPKRTDAYSLRTRPKTGGSASAKRWAGEAAPRCPCPRTFSNECHHQHPYPEEAQPSSPGLPPAKTDVSATPISGDTPPFFPEQNGGNVSKPIRVALLLTPI